MRRAWTSIMGMGLLGGLTLGCSEAGLEDSGAWDDDDMAYDDDDGDDDMAYDDDDGDDDDSAAAEEACDDVPLDPTTLYLSADDSNSMAAPALARQIIEQDGPVLAPTRTYEFLNYYDFYYPASSVGHLDIAVQAEAGPDDTTTMLIAVVAPSGEDLGRRPRSLTFSVDTSGSMGGPPIAVALEAMRQIAGNLEAGDRVAIVSWDSSANVVLPPLEVVGPDDPTLLAAIEQLTTSGSTNLNQGLVAAYDVATQMYAPDRLNRVILISDGGANTGQTDEDLIAQHAEDNEEDGIYLVGLGTSTTGLGYDDHLMDTVTDLGKGAYVYLDSEAEAAAMLGDDRRFTSIMEIAAMDVQLEMVMPAGYVMDEFHGEEYSGNPSEVEPQHLAPGDAQLFHQVLVDCAPAEHDGSETFEFTATWIDPVTRQQRVDSVTLSVDEMTAAASSQLTKATAVVTYAEALTAVWDLDTLDERRDYIDAVRATVDDAYYATGDADLAEILDLLATYRGNL